MNSPTDVDMQLPPDPHFFPSKPVWTPEIQRKATLVAELVTSDLPGANIWGIQRIGKSCFAEYLREVIPAMLGGTAVPLLWSFLGLKPRKPDDILRQCMLQSGCKAITARESLVLHSRLIDHIANGFAGSEARRVFIIVDEAQNIPLDGYGTLMSITADLQGQGLRPFVMSLSQPEMQQSIELLHQTKALQVIGRFFPRTETYHGLSVDDISSFLTNFDMDRQFSQKWFPKRAADGWSVTDLNAPIRWAIATILSERNISAGVRVPFGYLRPALINMFQFLADPKNVSSAIDNEKALECFRFTGLPLVIGHYVEILKTK